MRQGIFGSNRNALPSLARMRKDRIPPEPLSRYARAVKQSGTTRMRCSPVLGVLVRTIISSPRTSISRRAACAAPRASRVEYHDSKNCLASSDLASSTGDWSTRGATPATAMMIARMPAIPTAKGKSGIVDGRCELPAYVRSVRPGEVVVVAEHRC